MSTSHATKAMLRAAFKARRAALGSTYRKAANERLCKRTIELPAFREAEVVFTYLSFGSEVDTHALIQEAWRMRKTVALPACVPHTRIMRWYRTTSFDELAVGSFGLKEPVPNEQNEVIPSAHTRTVALVPALVFDHSCHRLGYGGGFYDTFLETFDGTSVGLCYDALMHADLKEEGALEVHDRPVNIVLTECRTFTRI